VAVSDSYVPAHPTRALIKVQDGCDNRCAYCLVTVARGPSRSRPAGEIVAEAVKAERAGQPEIILTGINLGVYKDAEVGDLAGLARTILDETNIPRIRFSSIEPQDFPLNLLDLWPNSRLCRHFHLPLQSGCDRTLTRMGRGYRIADFRALAEQIERRIPEVALTTDVLVGFPGETEADAADSLDTIAALPLSDLHIFPFSSRPGTAAAHMPNPVPPLVRRERCQKMHQLAHKMAQAFRKRFIAQELEVLWDGQNNSGWSGLSDNYLRVAAEKRGDWLGQITKTRILSLHETTLQGQIEG
jgi:threonylcarbamoyladenosine tRNA methylthiotransferase MtaB